MENIDIIALLLTVIAIFVAVFIFRRILVWVALIIILAVIGYFLLQNRQGDFTPNRGPAHRTVSYLEQFKDNYCGLLYDRDDSLMCYVIITPIYNDIVSNYPAQQLSHMNKSELTKIIIQTAYKHKKQIINQLKKNKALYLWQDFTFDIKNKTIY